MIWSHGRKRLRRRLHTMQGLRPTTTIIDDITTEERIIMDATARPPVRNRIGIYFGLPMEDYLADEALGSSDLRYLRRNPTSYWRNSHLNPKRKVRETSDYLERGTAMHVMLLEGENAFASQYMRGPDHTDDMTPAEKGAATKAANKKAESLGMISIKAADYDRILEARTIIKLNPDMASMFENGVAEVSIFWERDGVRRKARIDYLKVRGIGDLKSVSNPYDDDFENCCRRAIQNYGYHIQAAHYLEARAQIHDFVVRGMFFGEHDGALLTKIAKDKGVGWQWLFYCTEGPPDAFSYKLVHGNPIIENAQRNIELAIARYVRFKHFFGEQQWVLVKEPEHLTYEIMPPWFDRFSPQESDELAAWMAKKGAKT